MLQRFGVSANAVPNTCWTQFINHANYKIIDLNVIDWANATKIHTPPSAKRYFPPWRAISRPGMASYRKSLLTSHRSIMKMCCSCSCFMDKKYECLRFKIPICNQCSVFEENEDVEGWRAGRSVAYCKACDRELKRATQGLTLSEKQSIGSFRSNEKTR